MIYLLVVDFDIFLKDRKPASQVLIIPGSTHVHQHTQRSRHHHFHPFTNLLCLAASLTAHNCLAVPLLPQENASGIFPVFDNSLTSSSASFTSGSSSLFDSRHDGMDSRDPVAGGVSLDAYAQAPAQCWIDGVSAMFPDMWEDKRECWCVANMTDITTIAMVSTKFPTADSNPSETLTFSTKD
ncbi:hypothetical protein BD289DRAFT_175019 [Coniella lustricola]|uniref:Uncharacterized protein n=1 Tax=Coniella lustricola TaxID=2025994 RepID=A0A2T3ADV5_9PEZI|nr:hypothetical protein BD289DRAFT_175019 [Coniella lustricola]